MIIFLYVPILVLLVSWLLLGKNLYSFGLGCLFAFFTFMISCVVAVCISGYAYQHWPQEEYLAYTIPIAAMKDATAINGRIGGSFIRSGYINQEIVYRYMVKTDKGLSQETIKGKVYINYTDGPPHIEVINKRYSEEKARNLVELFLLNDYPAMYYVSYNVYVPEGSVVQEFEIDME